MINYRLTIKVLKQMYDDILDTKQHVSLMTDEKLREKLTKDAVELQECIKKLYDHYKKVADRLTPLE